MSNKTQLQVNNNTLDEYIARINTVKETAANLPSAGGGSGGGSVETCTVTLDASILFKGSFVGGFLELHYIGINGTVERIELINGDVSKATFTMSKGFLFIEDPMNIGVRDTTFGNAQTVNSNKGYILFFIDQDINADLLPIS